MGGLGRSYLQRSLEQWWHRGCCGRCEVSQAKQRVIREGKRAGGREEGGRGAGRRGEEGGERGEEVREDMTLLVYSVVYHGKLSKTTTTQEEND